MKYCTDKSCQESQNLGGANDIPIVLILHPASEDPIVLQRNHKAPNASNVMLKCKYNHRRKRPERQEKLPEENWSVFPAWRQFCHCKLSWSRHWSCAASGLSICSCDVLQERNHWGTRNLSRLWSHWQVPPETTDVQNISELFCHRQEHQVIREWQRDRIRGKGF